MNRGFLTSRGRSIRVLNITTDEKKMGVLLIEIYRKLISAQIYGHLDSILGGHSHMSGLVGFMNLGESGDFKTMREDKK
jgi:hypothetical protein